MARPKAEKPVLGLVIVLCLAAGLAVTAADDEPKVDSSLTFIAHTETIYVNIDNEPLAAWVKPIFEVMDTRFNGETKPRTIVVEVTLHPDRPADVAVAGRPALADAEAKLVLAAADRAKSPRTRVVDGTFRIVTRINRGTPDDSGPLVPPLVTLGNRKLALFKPANTAAKLALLQKWARVEALPLLAEFARRRTERKDEATRNFGKVLEAVKREGPIDVAALTDKNADYWRAMMEAPVGDPLVPAARIAMCVANGEIDHAKRIADAIGPFHTDDWGSSDLLRDLQWRLQLFDEEVTSRIRKGIALNDQGQFDEALKIYEAVLKDDPKSAWALHERFQTIMTRGLKSKVPVDTLMEGWPATKKAILEADPLYGSMASAEGPDELYDLLLRKESEALFKDRDQFSRDVIRYADIALDLGQPGFAAMLYWNARTSLDPESFGNRNLIEDVLYCLEQLGNKDMKTKYRGDHTAHFKRIDGERARRKQEMLKKQ